MADKKDNAPRRKTLDELLEITKQRGAAGREVTEQNAAEKPCQIFLPGMDEIMRALPNPVADSSLFAPVARGAKTMHAGSVLASRLNTTLTYWGVQLNELHADITMQLLWEQQRQGVAVGEFVTLNRNAFMTLIGWGSSGREYKRFHRYMLELTGAMLVIESKKPNGAKKYHIGATKTFRILDDFECDEGGENYRYRLDPRWVVMFGNREYGLLNWPKRLQIGAGRDLAKGLQRLLATSADPVQRFGLEMLKDKMKYASPMRKFREALQAAVHELERLEIIAKGSIEDSTKGKPQIVLWLQPAA
jgi:hypothetical protein